MVIKQERKLKDILKVASVTVRGGDIQNDPVAWEATNNQMRLKTIALHLIIDPVAWEATNNQMRSKTIALHQIIQNNPVAWEATNNQMRLKTIALHIWEFSPLDILGYSRRC